MLKPIRQKFTALLLLFFFAACTKESDLSPGDHASPASRENGGSGTAPQPGVLTAGEWNDLHHWGFWLDLMQDANFKAIPAYWSFYNYRRIAVEVRDLHQAPLANVAVELKRGGNILFAARTNHLGVAELWADLFQVNGVGAYSDLQIVLNQGALLLDTVIPYSQGINTAVLPALAPTERAELAFVVDATGSMSDEINYLKSELVDVIARVSTAHAQLSIATGAVFYRDEGDEYVTRLSDFSLRINTTMGFINNQSAGGGGDWPEAVHTALDVAVNQMQWSTDCKVRILFLVLDAPPHYRTDVISSLQASVRTAARKGIQIIPISASGSDKQTEFLMRFMAMTTNGTYVFLTDDSGVGDPHLVPTVGPYQVEFLNDLLVRLLNAQLQ